MTNIYSLESEQSVLGGVLIGGINALDKIETLQTEHFYEAAHRLIFSAIKKLAIEKKNIDISTVLAKLDAEGTTEEVGGIGYLADLHQNTPSAANIAAYANDVEERAASRVAYKVAHDLIADINESKGAGLDAIATAATQLENCLVTQQDDDATHDATDMALVGITDFSHRYDNQGSINGASTGFKDLDEQLSGLEKGNLYVIAGRPSMGKTAFSMNIADHAANTGMVLVFNAEMSKEQIAQRQLASAGGISLSDLRHGRDSDGTIFGKLDKATQIMKKRKMLIDFRVSLSTAQISAKAKKIKREQGLSLIVVDYLQLLQEPHFRKSDNKQGEIAYMSRAFKTMAKELDVPIILMSQLNRSVEQRADKRPMMSDLRESGAIEQDADVIMMLYRDEYYNENSMRKGILDVIIRKNRHGSLNVTVPLAFIGEFSQVRDLADNWIPPTQPQKVKYSFADKQYGADA